MAASKTIDLIGQRFGRLTVKSFAEYRYQPNGHKTAYWNCVCDCGETKIVSSGSLKNGATKSCGCLRKEMMRERQYRGGKSKLYGVHRMMKKRCYDKNYEHYKNYGQRGITVCDEWLGENGYLAFRKWAESNGYKDGLTLDRKDNDKGYSPENCTWETRKHQSNNKRNNVWVTINGETKTMAMWCEHYGVPYGRVEARYRKLGWSIEDALTIPARGKRG